jgi:pimeloyl-ACP methyl ester carboxylesterase
MKLLPSLIAALVFATTLHARVWTTTDNRTFEADYVSATATQLTVRLKDGRTAPFDIARLAQADRDFIAQQRAAQPTAPAAASVAPGAPAAPAKPATPAPPAAVGAPHPVGAPAAFKGPYAGDITGDWKQIEGKGGLQCMFFGSPTLDASKKWPLLVYLHGKGNNVLSRANLSFAAACAKPENYKERPCFILAPQCPDTNGWGGATGANLLKTLKDIMHQLPIDEERVYLAGHSMGAYGTYELLNQEPRMFAAGIPISGGCNIAYTQHLRRIPLWIFHGEKDDVVKPDDDRAFAKALEKMKAPTKYTEFPGEGHGITGKVENDPAVHEWLFAQKRK